MTPVPLELPLGAGDAGRLAEAIFQHAEGRALRDDVRSRIAARLPSLQLETVCPWIGSLAADPIHPSAYFLAADGLRHGDPHPLLLRIAAASTPASALFPNSLLIGRMRAGMGPEVVVNAIPFGPADHDNVRRFAADVDRAFQPRPQGARTPFAVATPHPASVLPGAFTAFRDLLRNRGINQAAVAAVDSTHDALQYTETAAVWSAIRAGWRDGFALEVRLADAVPGTARGYTTFVAPAELHEAIARLKAGAGMWKRFDPDPAIDARTSALTEILNRTAPGTIGDAILEFAVP